MNKEKLGLIVLPSSKLSDVAIHSETGNLIWFDDIPIHADEDYIPVNLLIFNKETNNISYGDLFILLEDLDTIHCCCGVKGDSVFGKVLKNEHQLSDEVFEHHPKHNVRKIIGSSSTVGMFFNAKLWILSEDEIKEIITNYNENK